MNSVTDSAALCTAIGCWWVAEGVKGWKPSHLAARCWGQGSPSFPLPTLLHVHCLGKLITLMGKDIPEELVMPSPDNSARPQGGGSGELLCRWERGYVCQLKLNSMLVVAWQIFFSYLL